MNRVMNRGIFLAGGLGLAALGVSNYMSYTKKGTFREFQGIFTAMEPEDRELYVSLIRKPMQLPERPIVAFFVIDYVNVGPLPMTRYQEGTVALRCMYDGQEGWHVKTMPVNKWVPNIGGIMLGFPKYVADDIYLKETGNGWLGEVKHNGRTMLSLDYRREIVRELEPWEEEMLQASGALQLQEPTFLFFPPEKGSRFQRVTLDRVVPDHWKEERGTVSVTIDKDEPWAGLISPGTEAPAYFQWFSGGTKLVAKKA